MSTQKSLQRPPEEPSVPEIIVAAQKVNWHYTHCCLELGYTERVTTLRSIIETAGYSWGTLACAIDPFALIERYPPLEIAIKPPTPKKPNTSGELAVLAKQFNWNQSAVCRHLGLKNVKAGIGYRKLKRWGYKDWTDFCMKNGKPRPPLSLELIIKAGEEHKWILSSMVKALQYTENGALVSWIQRNGYISWSEFRYKHAPTEYHPIREQLTFAAILKTAEENDWCMRDMEASLGYIAGAGAVRRWLKRRGYKWSEYIAEQLELPDISKTDTNTGTDLVCDEMTAMVKNNTAEVAARNGWHIDLTAWELDTDRKSLLQELAAQGFPNWKSFYEANQ